MAADKDPILTPDTPSTSSSESHFLKVKKGDATYSAKLFASEDEANAVGKLHVEDISDHPAIIDTSRIYSVKAYRYGRIVSVHVKTKKDIFWIDREDYTLIDALPRPPAAFIMSVFPDSSHRVDLCLDTYGELKTRGTCNYQKGTDGEFSFMYICRDNVP